MIKGKKEEETEEEEERYRATSLSQAVLSIH